MRGLWLVLVLASLFVPAARADEKLGDFSAWQAHRYDLEGTAVCNMWARPAKEEGKYTRRGEVYAFVLNRPADQRAGEISFEMGYPLKKNSRVRVAIGTSKFEMFTDGGTAFAWPDEEPKMIRAMRAGASMVVKGISSRGTETTDTYSLKGFTAAHNAINRGCK